jgi:hypothetical protein
VQSPQPSGLTMETVVAVLALVALLAALSGAQTDALAADPGGNRAMCADCEPSATRASMGGASRRRCADETRERCDRQQRCDEKLSRHFASSRSFAGNRCGR